jgi:hypothetical protein
MPADAQLNFHLLPQLTHVTNVCNVSNDTRDSTRTTYRHRLIRTSRLHLVICALSLLTSRAFECVRLGIGLANSFGVE